VIRKRAKQLCKPCIRKYSDLFMRVGLTVGHVADQNTAKLRSSPSSNLKSLCCPVNINARQKYEWTSSNFSHIPFGKQDAFLGSSPPPPPLQKTVRTVPLAPPVEMFVFIRFLPARFRRSAGIDVSKVLRRLGHWLGMIYHDIAIRQWH